MRPSLAVLAALALLAAAGCENAVDPTLGIDAPYSLYGYLDPTADRQAIRIAPIVLTLDPTPDTLDAAVTSTDLGTGAVTAWRDSLVTFDGGGRGHVFVADLTPTPGSRVRLEARRSDGAVAAVEVDVPAIVVPTVGPSEASPAEVTYPVVFEGAPRVLSGQLRLTVLGHPLAAPGLPRTLVVDVPAQPAETAPDQWTIEVPFLRAVRRALAEGNLLDARLELLVADYVAFVANDAWHVPTDNVDALVEPGVFSNVEGGFGFVGAGYRSTARWLPSEAVRAAAGFAVEGQGPDALVINEVLPSFTTSWVELYNPALTRVDLYRYSLSTDPSRPRNYVFPPGSRIEAGGFLVVDLPFPVRSYGYLGLFDPAQALIDETLLDSLVLAKDPESITFGSFPDGASKPIPGERTDLFRGPLTSTPGAPNALGIDVATIHEVSTEGPNGFVEVAGLDARFEAAEPKVFSCEGGAAPRGSPASGLHFGIARETPGVLDLLQTGGTACLAVRYYEPRVLRLVPGDPPNPPDGGTSVRVYRTRVVDVRSYGPQVPGRSVGYFPDLSGGWAQGLRPTPGAPNASARLGL